MINIKLPMWLNKGEALKLKQVFTAFWGRLATWLNYPISQFDPQTCNEKLLFLFAYQRDIKRLTGEPLELFRLRIKHAFANAQDSASVKGFEAIFKRLELGHVQTFERQKGYDWDVIILRVSDSQIAQNPVLLAEIIRQYGRACRRYFFEVVFPGDVALDYGSFANLTAYQGVKYREL